MTRADRPATSWPTAWSGTEGESASVGGGCGAGGSGEVPAKVGGGTETAGVRHALDGQVGLLQKLPGQQDPLSQYPLQRGGPGLGAEAAGEGSWRHAGVSGEPSQVQSFVEVVERPAAGGQQRRSTSLLGRDGLLDELGLITIAVGSDHGVAGDAGRGGGAVVAPHHMQAQVPSGRDPGAGQDVVVVDVEHA